MNRLGAMLPGSPWEAIWKPLAQWLGVEDEQLDAVMPNLKEFSGLGVVRARRRV